MNSDNMNYTTFATDFSRSVEERLRLADVQPEALFEIGIDAETRALAENLLTDFRRIVSDGVTHHVTHDTDAKITEAVNRVSGLVETVLDVSLACYGVWAFTNGSRLHGCVAAALIAIRFGFISRVFETVGKETVQAQSFSKTTAGILGAGVVFKLLDGILHASTFEECYEFTLKAIRANCNDQTASAMDTFLTFIQNILDWFCQFVAGKDFPFPLIGKSSMVVRGCLDNLNKLTIAKQSNSIAHDELVVQLEVEIKKLDKALQDLPRGSALHGIGSQASVAANRILVEIRTILGSASGSRVEPVCYIFVGAPGLGKTMFNNVVCDHFVYELSSDYMKEYFARDSQSVHKQIFAFDQSDQYCSGYRNQPVVVIDEIEPTPPASGMVSTPHRLIRMINSVACPLNMPDLGSKGVTFFNSRVIVGTTNNHNWANLPGVSDNGAFFRRVNFVSTVPDIVSLQRDFFPERGLMTFEDMRDRMHQYMREEHDKYQSGEYSLEEYLDASYKYVLFSIARPNSAGSIIAGSGTPIAPSELIRRVVQEAKTKASFAGNRVKLTERIIQEKRARDIPIQAESQFFGKLKDMVTKRYDFRPNDFQYEKVRENISNIFSEDRRKVAQANGMTGCTCKVCCEYFSDAELPRVALKMCKAVGSPIPRQEELHGIVQDMFNSNNWLVPPSYFPSFCKLEVKGDKTDFVRFYCSFLVLKDRAITKTMRVQDAFYVAGGVAQFAIDLAFVLFIIKLSKMAYNLATAEREVDEQGVYPLRPKKKAPPKKAPITVRVHEIQPEGGPEDLMQSLARTNVYKFTIRGDKPGSTFVSHFTMVQNQLAITPLHTVRGILDAYEFDREAVMVVEGCIQPLKTGGFTNKTQSIPLCNLIKDTPDGPDFVGGITEVCARFKNPTGEVTPTDMCMITIPVSARSRKTAFHEASFFSDTIDSLERSGCLVTIGEHGGVVIDQTTMYPERNWEAVKCSNNMFERSTQSEEEGTHWFGRHIIKYMASTRVGYCGAPIFMKRNGTYRIAGIHVAGATHGGWGYGVVVTAEDIARTIDLHLSDSDSTMREPFEEDIVAESGFVESAGRGTAHGHQESFVAKEPSLPTATSLRPSPIAHLVPGPDRLPAMLRASVVNGETIDPVSNAHKEYGRVERAPRLWLARMCMESVYDRMMRVPKLPGETRIPSYEETITAGERFPYVKSVPRNTSAGYPYCLYNKKKGKFDFFGMGDEYSFTSPRWIELVAEAESVKAKILAGERPLFVCLSFPKDERRTREKAETGKTRLISGGSILFTLLLRQCTMGFFNFLVRTRGNNGIAIGTNPYSEDWDSIAKRMGAWPGVPNQENCIAGDFSGFDKKLHYVWIMSFCDMITKFYGDADTPVAKIRKALFHEIAFSRHIVGQSIIEWVGSNPSGQSMTTPTNSASNAAMVRYVIVAETLERQGLAFNEQNAHEVLFFLFNPDAPVVRDETFGDDSLIAILDLDFEMSKWIDGQTLSDAFMKHLSVKYTDESKGDTQQKLRKLSECTFLKRGFKESGLSPSLKGRFMAPLELDSILDSVRWYKPNADGTGLAAFGRNLDHMLEELSLHDEETYQKYGNIIVDACASLEERPFNFPVVLPAQAVAQIRCCSRELEY